MATRKRAARGKDPSQGGDVDLSTHPLVAARKVDPSEIEPPPPEATALVGYIGPSRREGSIRLYQDLTFRNYFEIPVDAVLSTAPVNPDDENSPTLVRVDPEAKVEVVSISVQSVEARYLSGAIAGGFYAATAGPAAPAVLCTNITTHMPSCVAGPPPGPAAACTVVATTLGCTFGGGGGGTIVDRADTCRFMTTSLACTFTTGPTTGYPTPCTNITTHVPSCVHCNPNCLATVVTSGVPGGGPQVCIDLYTAVPSHCETVCDPRCVATVVTSHDPAAFAARAPQTTACMTIVTANPTDCGTPCRTIVTANPTDCGRAGFAAAPTPGLYPTPPPPYCITLYTANPTHCPVYCITVGYPTRVVPCAVTHQPTICRPPCGIVPTRFPTYCVPNPCGFVPTRFPSCDVQVTITITVGPGPLGAAAAAPPPPQCITLHTAVPTWCEGPDTGTVVCPTVYTAVPTGCG
jgi:hypothetical protein